MSKKHLFLSAIGISLLGSAAVLAQGQPQQPQMPMSFFIASTVPGGGNLGGLAGADQICQNLAASAGAGNSAPAANIANAKSKIPVRAREGAVTALSRSCYGAPSIRKLRRRIA